MFAILRGLGVAVVSAFAVVAATPSANACGPDEHDIAVTADSIDIPPDGRAWISITVHCDGAPLPDIPILLSIEPQPGSGGHHHYEHRPHGVLNDIALGDERSNMSVKTDGEGLARVLFEPPGKSAKSRGVGLAGVYEIQARIASSKGRAARLPILVRLKGLVPLEANPVEGLVILRGGTESHADGTHGRPAAIHRLQSLAGELRGTQLAHNERLEACGLGPWELRPLSVNDLSLPWGGVFDYKGIWAPPHQLHSRGVAADINHFFVPGRLPDCGGGAVPVDAWLMAVLLELGRAHGRWDGFDLAQPNRLMHLNLAP